jgi:predicted N-acetyltransferase YhbS
VVVSHEQEGLRGWFLLGSLSLQQQWKGKCVGAVLLELLVPIFEFCQFALMHVAWMHDKARVVLSHEPEGLRGWFLLGSLSLHPQVKGECVGAVLMGPFVSIFCCLSVVLMHLAWMTRAQVVLSH